MERQGVCSARRKEKEKIAVPMACDKRDMLLHPA